MQARRPDVPSDRAFLKWLIGSRTRDLGILAGAFYIIVALSSNRVLKDVLGDLIKRFSDTLANRNATDWLPALLQGLTLVFLPIACFTVEPARWVNEKYSVAIAACKQFRNALSFLVVTWMVFYFLIFLREIEVAGPRWDPWIDLLNTLQGVFLFVCYWVLTTKTIPGNGGAKDQPAPGAPPLWAVYSVLLWLLVVFLVADVYFSPIPVPGGADTAMSTVRIGFRLVSGLWVGVALALLIGCLEGQYVGQPRAVTVLLYFYAVLQLGYVGFNFQSSNSGDTHKAAVIAAAPGIPAGAVQNNPPPARDTAITGSPAPSPIPFAASQVSSGSSVTFLQVFSTVTSLPLKLLFIGYWYWVLQNGLLAFYMKKTRQDIDQVPGDWADFSFDFVLRASPNAQTVLPGDSATYTIHVDASSTASNSVDLNLRGLPDGATAAFHPPSVALDGKNHGETTYLTIITSSATPSADYSLTIMGNSGSMERTVSVRLIVGTGRSRSSAATSSN